MDFKDIPVRGVNLPYDDVVKIHGRLNAIEGSPCASDRIRAAVEIIREILGAPAAEVHTVAEFAQSDLGQLDAVGGFTTVP